MFSKQSQEAEVAVQNPGPTAAAAPAQQPSEKPLCGGASKRGFTVLSDVAYTFNDKVPYYNSPFILLNGPRTALRNVFNMETSIN